MAKTATRTTKTPAARRSSSAAVRKRAEPTGIKPAAPVVGGETNEEAAAKRASGKKRAAQSITALAERVSTRAKAERAREARALLETITRKIAQAEESFYEIGAALARLRDPGMFGALGFDTFESLLASIPKLSRQVAYRCLRTATSYDEPTALALAQSKAIALLTYVDATPEPDDAQALAEADAMIGGVAISKQTVEGILRAAAEVRPPSKRREREGEAEAERAAAALERRLRGAGARGVDVRVALRKKEWRLVVEVPAAAAARLTLARK
jgi:hypothetical protein